MFVGKIGRIHIHVHTADDAEWNSEKHPRGNPKNAGQFSSVPTGQRVVAKTNAIEQHNEASSISKYKRRAEQSLKMAQRQLDKKDWQENHVAIAGSIRDSVENVMQSMQVGRGDVKCNVDMFSFKTFELNGRQFNYAGSYSSENNEVTVFLQGCGTVDLIPSVAAHELMHHKFQTVFDAFKAEKAKLMNDLRSNPKILRADDTLRDEYKSQYPLYNQLNQLLHMGKLAEDDGCTDYSREWWTAYQKDGIDPLLPVHETLAEMAFLQWKEVLPRLLWFKESTTWKPLYDAVNKLYPTTIRKSA